MPLKSWTQSQVTVKVRTGCGGSCCVQEDVGNWSAEGCMSSPSQNPLGVLLVCIYVSLSSKIVAIKVLFLLLAYIFPEQD